MYLGIRNDLKRTIKSEDLNSCYNRTLYQYIEVISTETIMNDAIVDGEGGGGRVTHEFYSMAHARCNDGDYTCIR